MIQCSNCHRPFDPQAGGKSVASISGSISGDEYIESYFFCHHCQLYTVEIYHDRFLGEESVSVHGPIAKAEGDAKVQLINQCSRPWDKKCRCESHLTYFDGNLD